MFLRFQALQAKSAKLIIRSRIINIKLISMQDSCIEIVYIPCRPINLKVSHCYSVLKVVSVCFVLKQHYHDYHGYDNCRMGQLVKL